MTSLTEKALISYKEKFDADHYWSAKTGSTFFLQNVLQAVNMLYIILYEEQNSQVFFFHMLYNQ